MIRKDLSVEELEKKKLEFEIKELKKHWLTKPRYLSILLTAFLALISFIYTVRSGVFDKKYQTLKLEKANLQFEINSFNRKRDSVENEFNILNDSLGKLKYSLKRKEYDLFQKIYEMEQLKSENSEFLNLIEFYKDQLQNITYVNKKLGISDEALEGKYEEDYESMLSKDGKYLLNKDSTILKVKGKEK